MKIDHIGIAVNSIEEAAKFYKALGLEISGMEEVESQGVKTAFLKIGESNFELLEPLNSDSPVYKFIEKKGTGIHHIAILTENIKDVLANLKKEGFRLINETPVKGAHGKSVAFIHPKSSGGVLIELCEKNKNREE